MGRVTWVALLLALEIPLGCGGSDESEGAPRGEFVCQTTVEDCISIFRGTYSGTYEGDASGTWAVFISEDGSITGTATDAGGDEVALTGSIDETVQRVWRQGLPGCHRL